MSDTLETNFVVGLPSLSLIPSMDYNMLRGGTNYVLKVPKRGKYEDLLEDGDAFSDFFTGDFVTYDDDTGMIYPAVINKVLLALKKYPGIQTTDKTFPLFVLNLIETKEDTLNLYGEVVHLMSGPLGVDEEAEPTGE